MATIIIEGVILPIVVTVITVVASWCIKKVYKKAKEAWANEGTDADGVSKYGIE